MKNILMSNGFKANRHGDAYDRGNFRVFFDDATIHVIKFGNPVTQVVEWENVLDGNMGPEKAMKVIDAITA